MRCYVPPRTVVPPPKWAIGYTFELSISLPGPANKGGGRPKRKRKTGTGRSIKKPASKATKPRQRPEPDPVRVEANRQKWVEHEEVRRKSPERKKYRRRYAQEQRQKAKELGLCRNCNKPAIPGQTRCTTCAEHHRQSRRLSDAKRRVAAKGELA